jgi:SAM-dependent methyltransferase
MSSDRRPACPICDGPLDVRYELPHIWHQPRATRSHTISWCGPCDLGLLLPRPSREDLDRYYGDTYFSRYNEESGTRGGGPIPPAAGPPSLLDRLRVHIAWRSERRGPLGASDLHQVLGPAPSRICDIGCGAGHVLAGLKALGHDVVGVESDEDARRMAAAKGIEVFPGYAEDLPEEVKGRTFDLVSMTHVLEHCLDPLRALRNAAALLRPGGYLAVEVPNNEAILARRSGPSWYHCDAGRHVNFFTAKRLAKAVESLDLEVVEHRFGGYVSAFANDRVAAERAVWDSLNAGKGASHAGGGRRNSKPGQWRTLARTLLAPPARKYEAVGIIARRRG